MSRVEEKLYQNRYRVDVSSCHVSIKDPQVCLGCDNQACTVCCPAGCWSREEDGAVAVASDGCLECGTCRIVCDQHENVAWDYPRGGYGILFKFG